ncbi:nucleoside hydrolase [Paenibacillus sp. P96]|uniref:Nucleoside hydrolase n=1 Tax=Paenibacillus zeirhizosphaerae TaxID=2987519 RepID=A0ABT9FWH5_9BACL|nr:nucleoside hydrolase [Paenibacillus sp. P96]MDP4099074.1 nucleoside hydrolase [Paenibacillus sp. P96]
MKKRIILDVDTGIDDALAIGYAVHSPELELLGLTTTFGNISLPEATRNSLVLLEKLNKEIPVYEGADKPYARELFKPYVRHIHGEDGIGNCFSSHPLRSAAAEHAADFIIQQARKYPRELTVIAVGPLTNMALALDRCPELPELLDRLIIMGGAVTVPGNVKPTAEANIYADPEAAEYVLTAGFKLTLVGLDVTMQTLLPQSAVDAWRDQGSELAEFMADMTDFYMQAYQDFKPGIAGCALHDPLAVGVAIAPDFVTTQPMYVAVDTGDSPTVGRTYEISADEASTGAGKTIDVCVEVDAERFLQHFLGRIL